MAVTRNELHKLEADYKVAENLAAVDEKAVEQLRNDQIVAEERSRLSKELAAGLRTQLKKARKKSATQQAEASGAQSDMATNTAKVDNVALSTATRAGRRYLLSIQRHRGV